MTPLEKSLVDEFGGLYESYGFKRLEGLIIGFLLTREKPASLDDLSDALERSKGPISVAARRLSSIGVIQKVGGPINRRDYYAAHPDIFYNNFRFNMQTVRRNRRVARRFLDQLETTGDADNDHLRDNLEQMEAFYSLMESFYEDFSTRWQEVKAQRATARDSAA